MSSNTRHLFLVPQSLPEAWPAGLAGEAYLGIILWTDIADEKLAALFPDRRTLDSLSSGVQAVVRAFKPGVTNPMSQSLGRALGVPDSKIRVDKLIVTDPAQLSPEAFRQLEWLWREPAIEDLERLPLVEWDARNVTEPRPAARADDSFATKPSTIELARAFDLEFEPAEIIVLDQEAARRGRAWTRAELEVFAQTWSEHCKHKIFAAKISSRDTCQATTDGLFKEHIRRPTLEMMERRPGVCLSVFHDNAGVLALRTESNEPTPWAFCLKMETHNSPSAISPYGGASTGIVGVHRDILGTGIGALPIANWDVLCFESPQHTQARPATALPADVIRKGVIHGIEDGGNQSGIPTVQGSVVFDPRYAVKPLVFAGSIGLLPKTCVDKKPRPGLALYCVGGATGADGLRGAVMSSRDLRTSDFRGSAVQVASAFVQRVLTDFLMEARDQGLIDVSTDNGAGGFASSVGEMASLAGGATIDVTDIRLKFDGLHGWERLLSESQERMTVATAQPEAFEKLAREWRVDFDRLGELTGDGMFRVLYERRPTVDEQQPMVEITLDFLHDACPRLELKADWDAARERTTLADEIAQRPRARPDVLKDFEHLVGSDHLCSREGVVRRFDHEVQGRGLRKPFGGATQETPQDGALIEVSESALPASIVLAHGLAPQRADIVENVLHSFDEAVRSACLAGIRLDSAGLLDNFCWPDPIVRADSPPVVHRRLWRLVRSCETLSRLCRSFDLPLISGKDSMKNNSKDFAVPETIVVSIGGSAGPRLQAPVGFFSRANEVIFYVPPLRPTLADSAWERVTGQVATQGRNAIFASFDAEEVDLELTGLATQLRERYARVGQAIEHGLLRAAKDISEGGLLMTAFEMSLGRGMGVHFEAWEDDPLHWFGEGLGGFVVGIDPHRVRELEVALPEAKRLGVTMNVPVLRWGIGQELELSRLRDAYLRPGREGFWR
jgi:phosphoribosylformylglycinamidine (FGAM) synthase-like enzyme